MKKIAVVTATRAEYGILRSLIFRLQKETWINLQVLVTGTHLLEKYGNTKEEIKKDGVKIFAEIPILEADNSAFGISLTMANAIRGFAEYFQREKPELLIALGDRTEMLGICSAAMNACIPIAHLHGGELTEGAVDDCVRHAITKMSFLHFPAAEEYRKRIIQMGEEPERVFNVGALGVENIKKVPLLPYHELCDTIGIPEGKKYVVVTFHPVTLENNTCKEQAKALCQAMSRKKDYFYLITKANADAGGDTVNAIFERHSKQAENVKLVSSLGMVKYLSAVKYCEFVLGNSSSGIIEAPALGIPTVNIGDRQKGRMMADTIFTCNTDTPDIVNAMENAAAMEHKVSVLYGDGNTSEKILTVVTNFLQKGKIDLKKKFYDLESK